MPLAGLSRHQDPEITVPAAWLTLIMPFIRIHTLARWAPGMVASTAALAREEPISTRAYYLRAGEISSIERVSQRAALLDLYGASVCENRLNHLYPFLQPPLPLPRRPLVLFRSQAYRFCGWAGTRC